MNAAALSLALGLAGCATATPTPKPPPTVVISRTIIIPATEPLALGVAPGSKAGKALAAFRAEERAANAALSYPGATVEQLRAINKAEMVAHAATQTLISKHGRATSADVRHAHDSINELRAARRAPREKNQQ